MNAIPILPETRRRKTSAMICLYLEVEPTEPRIDMLSKVLKAGEIEAIIHLQKIMPHRNAWSAFIADCEQRLKEIRIVAESFFVLKDKLDSTGGEKHGTEKSK